MEEIKIFLGMIIGVISSTFLFVLSLPLILLTAVICTPLRIIEKINQAEKYL